MAPSGSAEASNRDARCRALWAVAFDPAVRVLEAAFMTVPAMVGVYADDTAVAAADLVVTGRRTFAMFEVIAPEVGTQLYPCKTQVVACFVGDVAPI